MKVGVVILNYNNAWETVKCATQFSEMNCIDEVVIVDNCSIDNSIEIFENFNLSKKKILINNYNGGYAEGNNLGIRYLAGKNYDIVFISNPDVFVKEDAILKTIDFLYNHSDYGCAAPRVVDSNGNNVILYGNHIVSFKETVLSNLCSRKIIVEHKLKQMTDGIFQDQSFLYGSFWGANVKALQDCDFLDPNTFLYREEEILAARMRENNYKLAYLLDVSYIHNHKYESEKCKKKIRDMKRLQESDLYYWRTYFNINKIRVFILKFSYWFCRCTHFIFYSIEDFIYGK